MKMSKDSTQREERIYQFCFVTYPESMGDIYDKIKRHALIGCRSPLHDRDWNEDGEIKKPHYHNMIIFSGAKSKKQVKLICDELGISHFELPFDKRGMLRYFCHLDENPGEKAIYDPEDVMTFGGFDYNSVLTAKDGVESKYASLFKWVRKKGEFASFRAFADIVAEEVPEYLDLLIDKAYFWSLYVRPRDQN